MPDDTKARNDALGSSNSLNLPGLGQFTYSFFTDENQNTTANVQPAVATPEGGNESTEAQCGFVHPAQQQQLDEEKKANQIDVGARYQKEFADKYLQSAATAVTEPAPVDQLSLAGAVEREAKAGFSAHFNFRLSLERIFRQLDANHDRRLSKDELGLVYADGRFTGDDELLVILLLHNLDEIRKTASTGFYDTRGVTFDDILSYPKWSQYLPAPVSSYTPNTWLQQAKTSSGKSSNSGISGSSLNFRRNTNR